MQGQRSMTVFPQTDAGEDSHAKEWKTDQKEISRGKQSGFLIEVSRRPSGYHSRVFRFGQQSRIAQLFR